MLVTILLLSTIVLWGVAPVVDKFGLRQADPITGIAIRSLVVTVVVMAGLLLAGKAGPVFRADGRTWLIFAASGLMAGLLGMWTFYGALKIAPASKIVPIAATYPLITAVLSVAVLGEEFSFYRLIGTILIIAGVWLVK